MQESRVLQILAWGLADKTAIIQEGGKTMIDE